MQQLSETDEVDTDLGDAVCDAALAMGYQLVLEVGRELTTSRDDACLKPVDIRDSWDYILP